VEFQGETKVLLAEKYSFVLQQSFHVIWSQNCYNRIEFELLIKMWATKNWNLWSFREKQRFCSQKNILLSFSKAFMCFSASAEMAFSLAVFFYLKHNAPLRFNLIKINVF
jgi:hypothetical protein